MPPSSLVWYRRPLMAYHWIRVHQGADPGTAACNNLVSPAFLASFSTWPSRGLCSSKTIHSFLNILSILSLLCLNWRHSLRWNAFPLPALLALFPINKINIWFKLKISLVWQQLISIYLLHKWWMVQLLEFRCRTSLKSRRRGNKKVKAQIILLKQWSWFCL